MTEDFLQELAVYHANLIDLLACAGQYVVIRGQEIHGPFSSLEHAWRAGRVRHGSGPFLVKRIEGETAFAGQAG